MKHLARLFLLVALALGWLPARAQLAQGLVVDPNAPPSLTVGKTYPLLLTPTGQLYTNASGGGGGAGDASAANQLTGIARLEAIRDRLPQTANNALLVGNSKNKLRDEFVAGGLSADNWDLIATGSGMTISTGNGTTGSYLRIQSGTTTNAETIIRSKEMFTLPVRYAAFVSASQRIANQEFFVELIEVDANGDPVTVASSQTNAGTWRNHASVKLDGTTATNALVTVRSGGAPEFVSAASTITTTAATGTDPNFFPAGYVEMQVTGEHVALIQGAVDSTTIPTMARRISQAAPNPTAPYKLQIRARNLATAPASSTDWRVHALRLFDFTRLDVSVIGGPGHGAGAVAVPVVATQSGTFQSVGAAAAGSTASGNPVQVGVVSATAIQTARTAGQIVANAHDKIGRYVGANEQIRDLTTMAPMVTLTTTTETTLVAAVSSIFNDLRALLITNTSATGVRVDFRTVSGGTVVFSVWVPPTTTLPVSLPVAARQATVNTAWTAQLSAAVTDVRITAWAIQVN